MIIGVTSGMVAGYYRGWIDTSFARHGRHARLPDPAAGHRARLGLLAEGLPARPLGAVGRAPERSPLFLIVPDLLRSADGGADIQPGLPVVIVVIALVGWPYIARIIRGQVLSLREKEFVEAARSLGASNARIIFREILPNLVAPIIVYTTLLIPTEHPVRGGAVVPRRRGPAADRELGRR